MRLPTTGKEMTQVRIFFLEIKCRNHKVLGHDLEDLLWQAGRPLLCVTGAVIVRCRQKLGNMAPSFFFSLGLESGGHL